MNRKLLALFLGVILMTLTVASDAFAQNYNVQNNSPVPISVSVQGICPGPPPLSWVSPVFVIPPGGVILIPIPPPPCYVTDINVNGVSYAMGYNGPTMPPPPPPPSWVMVNPLNAIIW